MMATNDDGDDNKSTEKTAHKFFKANWKFRSTSATVPSHLVRIVRRSPQMLKLLQIGFPRPSLDCRVSTTVVNPNLSNLAICDYYRCTLHLAVVAPRSLK